MNLTSRERMKLLRKRKKYKLRQIANQVGVSVPMLSMYENELTNLSKEKEAKYRISIMS
ncbi:helix-turn-helix domain-containing protein [Peribacillus sp. NPDC097197]|uniref:helix-turn-helix domain-containing protein n=1 Tax=Peribacillus sp. NPDC097197 TaxID=3390615 RepID=UPI003CFDC16F